ncbi:MAG: pilus assembly protein TadG-related protein [candidate division FCPU426 bacterium]
MDHVNNQSGQILPVSLIGMITVLIALMFMINVGRLVLERERVSERADVTAFSGAVDYSRALNLLAMIKKAEAAATAASAVAGSGASFLAWLKQADRILSEKGPWMVEASTIHIGFQNGLQVTPLWNVTDIFRARALKEGLRPDFNIPDWDGRTAAEYSYKKAGTDERVIVDGSEIEKIEVRGRNGVITYRYRLKGKKTFVKKDNAGEERSRHSLSIVAVGLLNQAPPTQSWVKPLPKVAAVSRVAVEGGNFRIFSLKSAHWEPFFRSAGDPAPAKP